MIVICGRRVVLDAQCGRPLDHAAGLSPDLSNTDDFNLCPDVHGIIGISLNDLAVVVFSTFTRCFMFDYF